MCDAPQAAGFSGIRYYAVLPCSGLCSGGKEEKDECLFNQQVVCDICSP
jgi:hypothetical protein